VYRTGFDAYLLIERGDRRVPLAGARSWTIGRSDGCAIVLDSRSVSRLHALIQRLESGQYCLIDLGSRNGSFVNRRRVGVPVTLQDQDGIVFGDEQLRFRLPPSLTSALKPESSLRNAPTTALLTNTTSTIVVVDIRDFTALARAISEELLSQTIGFWFLRVGQAAEQQGSWAQTYIGDAMMAVWVHDRPDVSLRDLRAPLQAICRIQAVTSELSRSLPLPGPLRIGAGMNTGSAILGNTDYTALGETVNVAFRLEAATKQLGLGVALGESTFKALQFPDCFERRQIELKGYEGATNVWGISFEQLELFVRDISPQ